MARGIVAALVVLSFVLQGTIGVLAGTTGSIAGVVTDSATKAPLSGVKVTASSASQVATTTTDANGHFSFLSLAPDTYSVSAAAASSRYTIASQSGVTVQADLSITVSLAESSLATIGTVTSKAGSSLVKPGTSVDSYTINATQQDKLSSLGGGGNLNTAWSALASVPGVYVSPGQNGYIGAGPSVSIRGGDYDQIGYEFDGVPVNRSFDNYPSGTLSSLGQQELQVYTGSTPANSEAQGISGYINQVIRTGTLPAYKTVDIAAGAPGFYNKAALEVGGANPSRTFSYYVGLGAYNQDFRYFDQYNGASISNTYGTALIPCVYTTAPVATCSGPGGSDYTNSGDPGAAPGGNTEAFALGPANISGTHETQVRDTVVNLHFGVPKADGTKDDIQALLDIDHLGTTAYTSANDVGDQAFLNAVFGGSPFYVDGYQYSGKLGAPLNVATVGSQVSTYLFPGSPTGRPMFANLPAGEEGSQSNDQNIAKLQYQHNFGTTAFLRVYGYTYYSDWLMRDPTAAFSEYDVGTYGAFSPDYELSSHTRGASVEFSDQWNSQNLLTVQGNYTTANSTRDNNTEWYNGFYGENSVNARTAIGVVVNAAAPTSGICFGTTMVGGPGTAVGCGYGGANTAAGGPGGMPGAQYLTLQQGLNGDNLVLPSSCAEAGVASTTCEYLNIGNGQYATYNTVKPIFTADIVNEIIAIKNIVMSIAEQEELLDDICNDVLGYGPLEPLLSRDDISDIMVNGAGTVFIEVAGRIQRTGIRFRDNQQLLNICQRIVSQVGRRVDESSPICDARLADGSRVNAIVPPLALDGPALTIRKFKKDKLTLDQLVKFGAISKEGAEILQIIGRCRANVLISGGTGSGKTTLLNCLTQLSTTKSASSPAKTPPNFNCSSHMWFGWKPGRPISRAKARSPCASWYVTAFVCAPNASSSAKSADRKHSTCCKP